MRTLLRKISNGTYFQGPDKWTSNPSEAFDFKMIDRALHFLEKWNLQDVEVAFCFKDHYCVTGMSRDKMTVDFSER